VDDTAAYEAEQAYREALHQMNQECEDCEVKAQLAAAEEVAQYADYVIRNVVHGTPYDDALDIYIQKKVAYRNTYGKGE